MDSLFALFVGALIVGALILGFAVGYGMGRDDQAHIDDAEAEQRDHARARHPSHVRTIR